MYSDIDVNVRLSALLFVIFPVNVLMKDFCKVRKRWVKGITFPSVKTSGNQEITKIKYVHENKDASYAD